MATEIYDNHTLYVITDCATKEQIKNTIWNAIEEYETENDVDLQCKFRINLIENREGESCGIAFIFITNPAVYHMILGYNPDGSARIEYVPDPNVRVERESEKDCEDKKEGKVTKPKKSKNWIDDEDYDEKKDEVPKIMVKLPPLMDITQFELTEEQYNSKCEVAREKGQPTDDITQMGKLHVFPARATAVEEKYVAHIIKCKNLPTWVTRESLKAEFAPFASDSTTIQYRYVKGTRVEETFPFVNINRERVGFVVFDPKTYDAYFALFMMKKIKFSRVLFDGTIETSITICGHSYRTDRDVMADLAQTRRPSQKQADKPKHRIIIQNDGESNCSSKSKRKPRTAKNPTVKQSSYATKTSNAFTLLKDP